jgi:hypothetical protein
MIEPQDKRIQRLEDGTPLEIIETLLNSIHNYYNRQIDIAVKAGAWDLAFIGIHSVAVTVGTGLFTNSSLTAFTRFLKEFVDTDEQGYNFSEIAEELHSWRQVLVHRWLSTRGYEFGFDMEQQVGWRRVDGVVLVNPVLLHKSFNQAFMASGKIWQWQNILSDNEQQDAKMRLLANFHRQ